jgi:hypothetical protein
LIAVIAVLGSAATVLAAAFSVTAIRARVFRSFLVVTIGAAALALTSAAPAGGGIESTPRRAEPLFTQVTAGAQTSSVTEPRAIRTATLTISTKTLASGAIVNADAHLLNVFSDLQIVAFRSRVEMRPRGDYSWFGNIPGDPFGRVILTVVGGKLGANITHRGRYFTVLPVKDNVYQASEVDISGFSDDDVSPPREIFGTGTGGSRTGRAVTVGTGPLDNGGLIRWFNWHFAATNGDVPAFDAVTDDGSIIDVLVFYSHGAADRTDLNQGSVIHTSAHPLPSNLLVRIQGGIDVANQSMVDSGVATHFNLLLDTATELEDLIDSGDVNDDLTIWDGLASIASAREGFAADIVVLVSGSEDHKGTTDFFDRISVVGAVAHENIFVHEIGHAMGLQHDWVTCLTKGECNLPSSGDWTNVPGNHGYVIAAADAGSAVYSIMGQDAACKAMGIPLDSCIWLARWSNPYVNVNGRPFGIAEGNPLPANEVGFLNAGLLFDVANTRKSACRLLSIC